MNDNIDYSQPFQDDQGQDVHFQSFQQNEQMGTNNDLQPGHEEFGGEFTDDDNLEGETELTEPELIDPELREPDGPARWMTDDEKIEESQDEDNGEENLNAEDLETYDGEENNDYTRLNRQSSTISISSKVSVALPGDPSNLRLFSKCEESPYYRRLTKLDKTKAISKGTEANLHRKKYTGRKLQRISMNGPLERYVQTRDMTFLTRQQGDTFFKYLYAERDYEIPVKITSRDASRDNMVDTADKTDPKVDSPIIGPKPAVRWANRHKIFPPLIDEYYKVESFWTGGTYKGEYVNRLFNHGTYQYGTGPKYESEFKEGHIHSKKHLGKVTYPRGDTFDGQWRKGRYEMGKICFADGLKFEPENWDYCTGNDRRFYTERQMGMMGGGQALYNDRLPPPWIPPGSYDVGYGIYDPCTRQIVNYDKRFIKLVNEREDGWFTKFCKKSPVVQERYEPSFLPDRLPDKYADKHYKM